MNTIGSHPGAIIFRLSLMVIIIAILTLVFFRYVDDTRLELEKRSLIQTKKIIDSSLAVAFASYAVKGRLNELNELHGANPFEFLEQYVELRTVYRGEIEQPSFGGLAPGWYYIRATGEVVYLPRFLRQPEYYTVVLNFEDLDRSGVFESERDRFQNLQFKKKPRP